MTLDEHARMLGIRSDSTAAAWSFLRAHPLPMPLQSLRLGAIDLEDAPFIPGILDEALTAYVQSLQDLRADFYGGTREAIEMTRRLGLLAIEAAGAMLILASEMGARAWITALEIVIDALVRSLNKLSAGAAAAFKAFWGVPPIIGALGGVAVLLGTLGVLAVVASGPVTVLAAGAAKGMSRGARIF